MNVVCYEWVCYERGLFWVVCYEWSVLNGLFWTDTNHMQLLKDDKI